MVNTCMAELIREVFPRNIARVPIEKNELILISQKQYTSASSELEVNIKVLVAPHRK